jgi:hypothetical protein
MMLTFSETSKQHATAFTKQRVLHHKRRLRAAKADVKLHLRPPIPHVEVSDGDVLRRHPLTALGLQNINKAVLRSRKESDKNRAGASETETHTTCPSFTQMRLPMHVLRTRNGCSSLKGREVGNDAVPTNFFAPSDGAFSVSWPKADVMASKKTANASGLMV